MSAVYLYRQTRETEESKKYIWKEQGQFKTLTIQTEHGEIKRADPRGVVSRKNWSKNGEKNTQTAGKLTVSERQV